MVSFQDTAKERWEEEYCKMNETNRKREGIAWYILDEIVVAHSANHKIPCPLCKKLLEAMDLLRKPYPEECRALYNARKRHKES